MRNYSLHPESVRRLFDSVAPHYDFLNHLLSMRRDVYWRKMAVRELEGLEGWILDIATGTADVAIEIVCADALGRKVFGIDFSKPMIRGARQKVLRRGLSERIALGLGDALFLPFRENTFCASVIAFGLRNIPDKDQALSEMTRVVQEGGRVIILEFTFPQTWLLKKLYPFYFQTLLPWVGGLISGDRGAYAYLPQSVLQFPNFRTYEAMMRKAGLENVRSRTLTCGIATLLAGEKRHP